MQTPETNEDKSRGVFMVLVFFAVFGLFMAVIGVIGARQTSLSVTPAPVELPYPTPTTALIDRVAPDFQLTSLDGDAVRLSDYQGRLVFVNFWATWCDPCKREMPAFQAFIEAQPPDGAVVLTVNQGEDEATIRSFLEGQGVSGIPVLLDSAFETSDAYGVYAIPVTFIVDGQGRMRAVKYGEMKPEDLHAYVQEYGSGES